MEHRSAYPGGGEFRQPLGQRYDGPGEGDGADLKLLLRQLSNDASQLAHDEVTLAKLELREIAQAFSDDVQVAGQTVVKDLAKVGIALSLATLAGLALTTGAILAIGALVGAVWAGGLIVGVLLLIAAGVFGMSAARDLQESEALRLEKGRRTLQQDTAVLKNEAQATKEFAREEASEFKHHASKEGPAARH